MRRNTLRGLRPTLAGVMKDYPKGMTPTIDHIFAGG